MHVASGVMILRWTQPFLSEEAVWLTRCLPGQIPAFCDQLTQTSQTLDIPQEPLCRSSRSSFSITAHHILRAVIIPPIIRGCICSHHVLSLWGAVIAHWHLVKISHHRWEGNWVWPFCLTEEVFCKEINPFHYTLQAARFTLSTKKLNLLRAGALVISISMFFSPAPPEG